MNDTSQRMRARANYVEFNAENYKSNFPKLHQAWPRGPAAPSISSGETSKIGFTRWSHEARDAVFEISTKVEAPEHTITVQLRPTEVYCEIGKKIVHDGPANPDRFFMFGPREQHSRTIYRDAFDTFRVYISSGLVAEAYQGVIGRPPPRGLQLFDYHTAESRMLRHLVMAAVATSRSDDQDLIGFESLGLALAINLVGTYCKSAGGELHKHATALVGWRLRRVIDYIDTRLAQDISLAELSAVAGLSRMHFAAQFRAARGISPHGYILQQKVRAALKLLSDESMSVGDVARKTGFKSHPQFIRVFRRVVGVSPTRWRSAVNPSRSADSFGSHGSAAGLVTKSKVPTRRTEEAVQP